ncbi:YagE family protein [Trichodelitschia bisporula]|uniref:YagE family protein n=1 Tax=Trichodelitschia bisporula TaxID=703511 RepID=A0A6G1HY36_9PEZI|nr:YagE family protein [Trichodelitschia bisporula]
MEPAASETTPLIPSTSHSSSKPHRTVTFNPTVSTSTPPDTYSDRPSTSSNVRTQPSTSGASTGSGPALSSLNSKLRRRNSQGAVQPPQSLPVQKIGPQRTTKTAQKLKILPDPEHGEDGSDEESGRDVYSQFTRIKDPTARRDAARLGREDRERLPRVTAYCAAGSYRLEALMRYLKGKSRIRGAAPKLFDECIYTPYRFTHHTDRVFWESGSGSSTPHTRRYSDSMVDVGNLSEQRHDRLDTQDEQNGDAESRNGAIVDDSSPSSALEPVRESLPQSPDFDTEVHTPEVFLFSYGTVVIWGMSVQEELRFLKEISKFEVEKLAKGDVQTEDFNFYYTREYQARIYNDFISLRDKKNYMTKLAISHALSQSVKTSLYEALVDNTIETTKGIPSQIALTGKVNLTRREINMQIGELFILRINIHLQGSVLDAPELMWAEPQLDPIYQAVRSYLEMDQRVSLLTERLNVIADLLAVLKDQLTHSHGEYLEWIVIVLIAAEIVVAGINIIVDLYAGVD